MTEQQQHQHTARPLEASFFANRSRLLGFLRHAGAGDQSEDLLQEAWIRLNAATIPQDGIADPLSYLFRLLHNLVLDWRRGEIRTRRRDEAWSEASGGAHPGVSEQPDGERILVARADLTTVSQALDGLGEPTAAIFRRHRLGGVTRREIAQEFGLGLSTVEKHLRRAHKAMIELAEALDEA